jgi:hypothetical protein
MYGYAVSYCSSYIIKQFVFIEQALVRIWKGKSSHNVASRSVEKKMIADALLSS